MSIAVYLRRKASKQTNNMVSVHFSPKIHSDCRDQARGPLGRNSRPRGRNFALNGAQGEVGVSLKKKKKKKKKKKNFFFF